MSSFCISLLYLSLTLNWLLIHPALYATVSILLRVCEQDIAVLNSAVKLATNQGVGDNFMSFM